MRKPITHKDCVLARAGFKGDVRWLSPERNGLRWGALPATTREEGGRVAGSSSIADLRVMNEDAILDFRYQEVIGTGWDGQPENWFDWYAS